MPRLRHLCSCRNRTDQSSGASLANLYPLPRQREEDYSYFHLLNASISPDTIFGISCNRQIPADSLLNKDKTVTRSTVQKAIVVLASKVSRKTYNGRL